MITLKGITWDHKRGYDPLIATTKSFAKEHPDIEITWNKRTLKEFGDMPVSGLAETYDLLLIDHPFTGEAYDKGLFADLSKQIPAPVMKVVRDNEIGSTFSSYTWEGTQQALPVDTAAQVAAVREDLLDRVGSARPNTLDELWTLAKELPAGVHILTPLCPTDIFCIFLSMGGAHMGQAYITRERGINLSAAEFAVEQIKRLKEISHEKSLTYNPILTLEHMTNSDEIIYAPFLFGYVNYSMQGALKPIRFHNSPLWQEAKTATVLGGVGIAVSAKCAHVEAAVRYVQYVTDPAVQAGEYFLSGGQPALRSAWESDETNKLANNFFRNTIQTIERAYLRPRFPGWNRFQEKGGDLLHELVVKDAPSREIAVAMNELLCKELDLK